MELHRFSLGRASRPLCGWGVEANRTVPTVVLPIGVKRAGLLAVRSASMICGEMQLLTMVH